MAIKTVHFKTREDGVILNRTYSDIGMKLERDGEKYDEAIDDAAFNYQYIETDEPINSEATIEDCIGALKSVGVNFDEESNIE